MRRRVLRASRGPAPLPGPQGPSHKRRATSEARRAHEAAPAQPRPAAPSSPSKPTTLPPRRTATRSGALEPIETIGRTDASPTYDAPDKHHGFVSANAFTPRFDPRSACPDYGLPLDSAAALRWPGSLPPDAAERCHYPQREASRRWVGDLQTRGGYLRWDRIRRCGDPVAVVRAGDWALSWQHRWCRDRACYGCARSRSRRLAEELRAAITTRPGARLFFVTLTQPKRAGESARAAWDRYVRSWAALRHHPAFKNLHGGVRVTEVTWSLGHRRAKVKVPGWHVHPHLVVELLEEPSWEPCPTCEGRRRCSTCGSATQPSSGRMPSALVELGCAWTSITGASWKAQCMVPVDERNVGQLAKYLTKLWELDTSRARELFDAAAGRRIVDGFGAWRRWRQFAGDVERTPVGWFASGVTLRAIEHMHPDAPVHFVARIPVRLESDTHPMWRPLATVFQTTAGEVLRRIRGDPTPVWQRVKEQPPPSTAPALVAIGSTLRELARSMYPAPRAGAPPRPTELARFWRGDDVGTRPRSDLYPDEPRPPGEGCTLPPRHWPPAAVAWEQSVDVDELDAHRWGY